MSVFQFRMYVALGFSLRLSPCRRSIMRLKMRISILLILLSILPNLSSSSSSSSSSNSSYFIRREGREAAVNNSINKFKLSQQDPLMRKILKWRVSACKLRVQTPANPSFCLQVALKCSSCFARKYRLHIFQRDSHKTYFGFALRPPKKCP